MPGDIQQVTPMIAGKIISLTNPFPVLDVLDVSSFTFSQTGAIGAANSLIIAGQAGLFGKLRSLTISGQGLAAALSAFHVTITGGTGDPWETYIWSGPALGLYQHILFSGNGIISQIASTLTVSLTGVALVTTTVSCQGTYSAS